MRRISAFFASFLIFTLIGCQGDEKYKSTEKNEFYSKQTYGDFVPLDKECIRNFTLPYINIYSINNYAKFQGAHRLSPMQDSIFKIYLKSDSYMRFPEIAGISLTSIIKREKRGNTEAIIYTDNKYDEFDPGEDGYWIALRIDSIWYKYYTGLSANTPLHLKWDSNLPLIKNEKTLSIETALVRLTSPGGHGISPEYELIRDGLLVEFMIDSLKKDSDYDGLTDIIERKLMLNPYLVDSDCDGISDLKDLNPRFKSIKTEKTIIYETILNDSIRINFYFYKSLHNDLKQVTMLANDKTDTYLIVTDDKELQGISPINKKFIILSTLDFETYCKMYPNQLMGYSISPFFKVDKYKGTFILDVNNVGGASYLIKKTKKGWKIKLLSTTFY